MQLIKITPAWFETCDGRYSLVKSGPVWRLATCRDGCWSSVVFRTKREAATEIARRLTEDRTNA